MNKNACCCTPPAFLLMLIVLSMLTYVSLKQGVRPHFPTVRPSQAAVR